MKNPSQQIGENNLMSKKPKWVGNKWLKSNLCETRMTNSSM